MRLLTSLAATILIGGCVVHLNLDEDKPLQRAVHVGEKDKVVFSYSRVRPAGNSCRPVGEFLRVVKHGEIALLLRGSHA